MKVITLLNEKGGVGKTTLSTHLAAGMALQGHRVILIDADSQANATAAFGVPESGDFYDIIVRPEKTSWQEALKVIPPQRYTVPDEAPHVTGQLLLLPGNVETRNIAQTVSDAWTLLERLKTLRDYVDYVFIDTSPTPSLLHNMIVMATDFVIYPTRLEYWSFRGLAKGMAHNERYTPIREQYHLQPVRTLGIVPTMARLATVEHQANRDQLIEQYGALVWEVLPDRIIWTEASAAQMAVFAYAPQSKAGQDALRLLEQFEVRLHEYV